MTRAFSAFARNGVLVDPVYIRRIRDRNGVVVEDHTSLGDPVGPFGDRLDRLVAMAGVRAEPVIAPRTGYLTSKLLRHVVTRGHAPALRATGLPAAGKTGTSSATMDTWFIGFTSRWMTSTWMGDDLRERPLGQKDAAFMLTVPLFARYMWEVASQQPLQDIPWDRPKGVRPNDNGGNLRTTLEEVVGDAAPNDPRAASKRESPPPASSQEIPRPTSKSGSSKSRSTKMVVKPAAPAAPSSAAAGADSKKPSAQLAAPLPKLTQMQRATTPTATVKPSTPTPTPTPPAPASGSKTKPTKH
jgi:membrane carboxypeptidase/penicillin-binding protein